MGKSTYAGLVPKDDTMFSGGPQIFSRHESKKSSTNSAPATTGVTPERTSPEALRDRAKEKGLADRMAKMTPEQMDELTRGLM